MGAYHTITTSGFSVQHGDDARACGGVTHLGVARTTAGEYRMCSTDTNGRYQSSGKSYRVTPREVVAAIEGSIARGAKNGGMSPKEAAALVDRLHLLAWLSAASPIPDKVKVTRRTPKVKD